MKPLGPAEIIMPISAPSGVEIPTECQDNEETGEEEDDDSSD